ncbi:MAG: terpene cyclase/mutase family protein [Planctomycetales bacterium]|nr:terpene cyclase/mutase family protein [Planctomycetales bacterium]
MKYSYPKESMAHLEEWSRPIACGAWVLYLWIGGPPSTLSTALAQNQAAAIANDENLAIQRACEFLLSKQRIDGAVVDQQYDTTMTSLAIMAMASVGNLPTSPGRQGEAVRRALDFVLQADRQEPNGYFGNRDGSRMYGHGITTLMLTEMLGMGADQQQDDRILAACQKAIDLILSAQQQTKASRFQGGWRYTPNSTDSDLSVSVWQLLALRSAKNDELNVPSGAIDAAIKYLERSYVARLDSRGIPTQSLAGFSYLPDNQNATFAMTAAGLLAMQVCGQYESPLVSGSTEWLLRNPPKWKDRYFFYGMYYYAQGMHQRGGNIAEDAKRVARELLLPQQQNDGSWMAPGGEELGAGKVYATCLAILSLSVEYHYLPIYQR